MGGVASLQLQRLPLPSMALLQMRIEQLQVLHLGDSQRVQVACLSEAVKSLRPWAVSGIYGVEGKLSTSLDAGSAGTFLAHLELP